MKYTKVEIDESRKYLKKICKKGDTLYTCLNNTSRSGMMRDISIFIIKKNQPIRLDYHILRVLTNVSNGKIGLKLSGCGMDMGYHIVNSLSCSLFCSKGYTHKGAYALNHQWLN